jgi:hypothetical protein
LSEPVLIAFPRLLTVADIKRQLQIGERQAYELIHEIGAVKLGRSLRCRPEDLEQFLTCKAEESRGERHLEAG